MAWTAMATMLEGLLEDLPSSLYSAWAQLEDFAEMHPFHGLTGRWKQYLAGHILNEAKSEEDLAEAAQLRVEAEQHLCIYDQCLAAIRSFEASKLGPINGSLTPDQL